MEPLGGVSDQQSEWYEWLASVTPKGGRPDRRVLQAEYDRLEDRIRAIEQHELPNAHLRGGVTNERRVRAKRDRFDAQLTELHQLLFPAATWDDLAEQEALGLRCVYCHELAFKDTRERHRHVGVCESCDPTTNPPTNRR
jgi:hypothetical protein